MLVETTYVIYLVISIFITVWVARTLSKNGYLFLVDGFGGNEALAKSINHLLVVGFYLINLGWVSLALRMGTKPQNIVEAIEFLSTKIGLVLIVLGVLHFINMRVISNYREQQRRLAAFDYNESVAIHS